MDASLLIADSSTETGALLKEYLQARGVRIVPKSDRVISYGVPRPGALGNTRPSTRPPGFGKIYNMQRMNQMGVRTVPWFEGTQVPNGFRFPALARAAHGYGGTDIVPVFQPEEIPWRVAAGWSWFSSYVPVDQEYRVWVWRGEHLDTYKKQMNRPQDYKYIGRNFRSGFDFIHVPPERDVTDIAIKAVDCLHLDFAAVDLLRGKDGLLYILETNTAPGVIRSGAQATLGKLADKMVEWLKTGCPERGF